MLKRYQSKRGVVTLAAYALIALIFAVVLFNSVGVGWAFFALFALWLTGNMVAWFNRHPPPPHNLDL